MLFGKPELLTWLTAVPVILVLAVLGAWFRSRRVRAWGDAELWQRMARGRSAWLRSLRLLFAVCALAGAILAAARPQVEAQLVQVERQGIDVVIALDVSLSMEATDVAPNRLDRSRQEIREIADELRGDRVGVVLFSGTSFLLCPLTVDIGAANLFLDVVEADVLPDPGTNLEEALKGALDALGEEQTDRGQAVILMTDGEGHEGDAMAAAQLLAERNVPVMTVGVGTPRGEPIPILDARGQIEGYKKDRGGQVVLSRLDEGVLREIAGLTGGQYFPATLQGREVSDILRALQSLQKGNLGGGFRKRAEERFQIPAAMALALLGLALWIPEAGRRGEQA